MSLLTVKDIMSDHLITMNMNGTVYDARILMMRERIRHIPVVDEEDNFVGLLTQRDLLACSPSALADLKPDELVELETGIPVKDVMTTDITVVTADTDLREVATYLLRHKYGCLPVVSDSTLVGIVTEADFLKLVLNLLDQFEENYAEEARSA